MLNNVNSVISRQLSKLTKERKLKDSDILRKCGFTRPTLIKIKNEGNINVETLAALANGLGVKVSFFLDEDVMVEEYHAHGERGLAVKHIDLVDQRQEQVESSSEDEDIASLKKKIEELQTKLLEAQSKIIKLMEEKEI